MYYTRRWGLECCKTYFDLSDAVERMVAGVKGEALLYDMWEQDPVGFYEHPWPILRQEWWHAYRLDYQHAGFWQALAPNACVLDYGCGAAAVCQPWIQQGGDTTLIDVSQVALNYVRHKYGAWGLSGRLHICDDLGCISMHEAFDALVCTDVLEHVPDPMTIQRQLWALLKPGGQALLKMDKCYPHAGHLAEAVAQYEDWWKWLLTEPEIVEVESYAWVRKRG